MPDKALTGREGSGEGSDTPRRWGTRGRQRDAQGVPLSEFRDEKLPADVARAQEFKSKAQEVLDSGVLGLSKTPPPIVQVLAAGSVEALNAQGGAKIGQGKSATPKVILRCSNGGSVHDTGIALRIRLPRRGDEVSLPLVVEIQETVQSPPDHITVPGADAPVLTCKECFKRRTFTLTQLLEVSCTALVRDTRDGKRHVGQF